MSVARLGTGQMRVRAETARLLRFAVVGASNTAITLGLFALATACGLPAGIASAVGFAAGATNGYYWNARWTFAVRARPGTATRYVAVQAFAAALSAAGVIAVRGEGLARWPAEIVILPLVTVVGYVLSRQLVFRPSGI